MINDGDSATVARTSIVAGDYTRMGMSITQNASSTNKYLVDVVFAKDYTNSATVAVCQVTRDFGGDICDPTDYEKSVFINQNSVRTDPTYFATTFDSVVAAFVPAADTSLDCIYDYNGDGSTTQRTFSSKRSGVSAAKTTTSAFAAMSPLKWSPGLYLSA